MSGTRKLLVIDDDVELGRMLREFFSAAGWAVETSVTGRGGLERAREGDHQMVLLDVMLPDADGFELCCRLRAQSNVPILMLTACGADNDRIRGLELGADDYLAKPFNPRELLARVSAVLRRNELGRAEAGPPSGERNEATILCGPLVIDTVTRQASLDGREIELTGLEFNLLQLLARQPGRVLTRGAIIAALHGGEFQIPGRSVDVHVSHPRSDTLLIRGSCPCCPTG